MGLLTVIQTWRKEREVELQSLQTSVTTTIITKTLIKVTFKFNETTLPPTHSPNDNND